MKIVFLVLLIVVCVKASIGDEIEHKNEVSIKNYTGNKLIGGNNAFGCDVNLNASDLESEHIKKWSPEIFKALPPFNFDGHHVSSECLKSSQEFVKALRNFEFWALQMHDASAKLSSGVLNGNVNQYGDFDQCLNAVNPSGNFKSQYCLASIQPDVPKENELLSRIRTLSLAYDPYVSKFEDPHHVLPKTSQINWALCVPSTCTFNEIRTVLHEKLQTFFNSTSIKVEVEVREEMCQTKQNSFTLDFDAKVTIVFVAILLTITILSTLYESYEASERKSKKIENNYRSKNLTQYEWFTAFSLKKNFKDLISVEPVKGDILVVHGIRFYLTLMLVITHKAYTLWFEPAPNRREFGIVTASKSTVFLRMSSFYTDGFLTISGMLVAYSFIGRLQRGQNIKFAKEIAARYFRVVPPMAGLIFFGTFILPLLGSGPQWTNMITNQSLLCKQNWWRNFLMIHNWFGFENICMTHTHHVGNDFELFLVAPFIITTLYKFPKKGSIALLVMTLITTVVQFLISYTKGVNCYIYFGIEIAKLYDAANFIYILPHGRFTVYAIGIGLGYLLRTHKDKKLSNAQINLGWFVSTTGFIASHFVSALINRETTRMNSALYSALAMIPYCLFFAWTIYVAHKGYKNKFIRMLEWRGFLITTKLSYGIYLMQYAVMHFNLGRIRYPVPFNSTLTALINLNELSSLILASLVLTMLFDYPFGNLKKLIFDSKKPENKTPLMEPGAPKKGQ